MYRDWHLIFYLTVAALAAAPPLPITACLSLSLSSLPLLHPSANKIWVVLGNEVLPKSHQQASQLGHHLNGMSLRWRPTYWLTRWKDSIRASGTPQEEEVPQVKTSPTPLHSNQHGRESTKVKYQEEWAAISRMWCDIPRKPPSRYQESVITKIYLQRCTSERDTSSVKR